MSPVKEAIRELEKNLEFVPLLISNLSTPDVDIMLHNESKIKERASFFSGSHLWNLYKDKIVENYKIELYCLL